MTQHNAYKYPDFNPNTPLGYILCLHERDVYFKRNTRSGLMYCRRQMKCEQRGQRFSAFHRVAVVITDRHAHPVWVSFVAGSFYVRSLASSLERATFVLSTDRTLRSAVSLVAVARVGEASTLLALWPPVLRICFHHRSVISRCRQRNRAERQGSKK